jgi:hypothetical protein
MSGQKLPNSTLSSEWLPDLALHIPFDNVHSYPTVIEFEESIRTAGQVPLFPTHASSAQEKIAAAQIISELRTQSKCGCPAQTAMNSGHDSDSRVAGLQDRVWSTTSVSHIADNGSTKEISTVARPCRHPSDCFPGPQDAPGQRSSRPSNALGHMKIQSSPSARSHSSGWMLERWLAQPPSQEPYNHIE